MSHLASTSLVLDGVIAVPEPSSIVLTVTALCSLLVFVRRRHRCRPYVTYSTDTLPYNDQPPGNDAPDPPSTANFKKDDGLANGYDDGYAVTGSVSFDDSQNYLTDVGAYTLSVSPYGTFDQAGNVREWTEPLDEKSPITFGRVIRNNRWNATETGASSGCGATAPPTREFVDLGFRVATMPEPSSLLLGAMASVGPLVWYSRFRCHQAFVAKQPCGT